MTGSSLPAPLRTAALIVAAGGGTRIGGLPKQYRELAGRSVLARSVRAFQGHPQVSEVQVVIGAGHESLYSEAVAGLALPPPVIGGATRQKSVLRGLEALATAAPDRVLIHDAARPLVTPGMIDAVIAALDNHDGAVPVLPVVDSLRTGDGMLSGEVQRDGLWRAQTPQGFRFAAVLEAHRTAARQGREATDDAMLVHWAGRTVALTPGDERAFKLTMPEDFARAEHLLAATLVPRTGSGFDVHRFGPGDHVWLCGVKVPYSAGFIAHSDGDVGLHALTDAILGAIAEGDIGKHFPPSDPQWKGAASHQFLAHAGHLVAARGGRIVHVDVTLICERPKVGPHREAMQGRIAEILGLGDGCVSVKATTTEGLGFTGRQEGIAAQAIATVLVPA
jgi:2-C-methyl-D-erythritol 4-phosphate cytidylyltransferase/2-C-methyl-D-erythritol 2,4-cyclodiphosphate synthase